MGGFCPSCRLHSSCTVLTQLSSSACRLGPQHSHVSLHQQHECLRMLRARWRTELLPWLQDSANGKPAVPAGSSNGASEPKAQTSGKSLPGSAFRSLKSMSFKRRPSQGVSSFPLSKHFMPWPCSCMPRSTLGRRGSESLGRRPALLVICSDCVNTRASPLQLAGRCCKISGDGPQVLLA